jgi:hypothetical protein
MMSFYIEESRDKPLTDVYGVLPELGEGGGAVEAQAADQGLKWGQANDCKLGKLFQSTSEFNIYLF